MAQIGASPFNGPTDTGLRVLTLLAAVYPRRLDLGSLVLLDYLLVHSGDLPDGPVSLHPASPLRSGEVTVRRQLIDYAVALYMSRGLVLRHFGQSGIEYAAGDLAAGFLDAMRTAYAGRLRERADWVAELTERYSSQELREVVDSTFDRWREEFAVLLPSEAEEMAVE